jgi:hypothetical protein
MFKSEHKIIFNLEVLTGVKMTMVVFWIVMPCGLVGGYQHFGGTSPSSGLHPPTSPHSVTRKKATHIF